MGTIFYLYKNGVRIQVSIYEYYARCPKLKPSWIIGYLRQA